MFTGIIADMGEIEKIEEAGDSLRLSVRAPLLADCDIGASVALNGVCLTVVDLDGETVRFDVSPETQTRSTLGGLDPGSPVNIERPMRAGEEFGGHIVQGHVDGVGVITSISPEADGRRMRIAVSDELARYVVEKGSICVDGVSLTATDVDRGSFEVALVPHTLAVTTLGNAGPDTRVNIEVDVLAKYVEKLVGGPQSAAREAS
ncbi:MAG: riboflavin synthase [Actinomycetota bacterium]